MGFGKINRIKPFVTVFESTSGSRIREAHSMAPSELERIIRDEDPASSKDGLALLKLARFGTVRSPKGRILRHDANVLAVSGIEGDYDGEKMPMSAAIEALRAAGLAAVLYTSASHTAQRPRWRVLAFLSAPLEGPVDQLRERRRHSVGVLNAILGGVLKGESFALSQSFYFGRIKGRPDPEIVRLSGACIDQLANPPQPVFPGSGSRPAARSKLNGDDGVAPDRSADLLKRVAEDVWAGKADYQILAAHISHPHAVDQSDPERAIRRCIDKARQSSQPISRNETGSAENDVRDDATAPERLSLSDMLARFVHIAKGPQIVDLNNIRRAWRTHEFAAAFAHCRQRSDDKTVPITVLWSRSSKRKTADARTFNPAESQFFVEHGLRQFNTWIAPNWPGTAAEYAAPFFEHLEYLIPDARGREDLIDWLAHAVQKPGLRPHYHFLLVAQSSEGTGRSWIGDLMRRLFGERHAGDIDLHKLLGDQFNSELAGKVVMTVHEVKAPSDERYAQRDRLKSLLTDTWLKVNEKFEVRWTELFVTRFLMLTNRDDALPLSETDRRVYAVRCVDKPRKPKYYSRLYARLKDEQFLAAVWTALSERDLSAFNPGRRPPLNEMKQQIINAGRSSEQQTAVDLVKACPHPVVSAKDLMNALVRPFEHESPRDRKGRALAVIAALKDIGKQALQKKVRIDDSVTRIWVLKDPADWVNASTSQLADMAKKARHEFKLLEWDADALIARWAKANKVKTDGK
jgi:hypothetical protein